MQSTLALSALKRLGKGAYRIAWFGNIVRKTTLDGVSVVFTPLSIDPSTGEERSDVFKHIPVMVPIAFLRALRIGDIWEDCRWTGRRDTRAKETFHLDVTENNTAVMPAGALTEKDSSNPKFLLPFSAFAGHREHTNSQCLRIALQDGASLVIPCMELIRFYFGASGSFLKRLLSGPFALERLYTDARLNPRSGTANIELAPDLHGVAATTVARIAFCKQAASAARWIVNSGVASAANRLDYYPKTNFPFHGKTDLTAYGRWIIDGNSRTFLAEQLSSCTHPFPFETLFYTTRQTLTKSDVGIDPTRSPEKMDTSNSDRKEAAIQLTDGPISSSLQSMGIPSCDEATLSFPDLANKKIRRVKNATQPPFSSKSKEPNAELGAGFATSSSTMRGAELATDLDEISIDELPPPDAALQIENQVRTIGTSSRGDYLTWWPIIDPYQFDTHQQAFVRCDRIFKDNNDRQLQNIWAGLIQIRIFSISLCVLVLVRDNATEDAENNVLMLRLERENLEEDIEICCRTFAAGAKPEAYTVHAIDMLHPKWTLKLRIALDRLAAAYPSQTQIEQRRLIRHTERLAKISVGMPMHQH